MNKLAIVSKDAETYTISNDYDTILDTENRHMILIDLHEINDALTDDNTLTTMGYSERRAITLANNFQLFTDEEFNAIDFELDHYASHGIAREAIIIDLIQSLAKNKVREYHISKNKLEDTKYIEHFYISNNDNDINIHSIDIPTLSPNFNIYNGEKPSEQFIKLMLKYKEVSYSYSQDYMNQWYEYDKRRDNFKRELLKYNIIRNQEYNYEINATKAKQHSSRLKSKYKKIIKDTSVTDLLQTIVNFNDKLENIWMSQKFCDCIQTNKFDYENIELRVRVFEEEFGKNSYRKIPGFNKMLKLIKQYPKYFTKEFNFYKDKKQKYYFDYRRILDNNLNKQFLLSLSLLSELESKSRNEFKLLKTSFGFKLQQALKRIEKQLDVSLRM